MTYIFKKRIYIVEVTMKVQNAYVSVSVNINFVHHSLSIDQHLFIILRVNIPISNSIKIQPQEVEQF